LVLLEYLAVGKPFLAYKTGMVAEQLVTEFPICFIDNFNSEEWLKRIEIIESNYVQLSMKMVQYFKENYSEENYIKECRRIYEKIKIC
jgi:glycosyltransferase involved in cell wall biosynthesis